MTCARASVTLIALLSGACRFAGPEDHPAILSDVDPDLPKEEPESEDDADEGSGPLIDARAPARFTGDARTAPADAAVLDAATAIRDGSAAARDAATEGRPDSSASCDPPPDLACDPVSGEGCLLLMQCLVAPGSSEPAATCVFGGVQLDVTCTQDAVSTDCPSQHTCVMGACRKYCYCDADCESGASCTEPSGEGSPRFRLCEQTATP